MKTDPKKIQITNCFLKMLIVGVSRRFCWLKLLVFLNTPRSAYCADCFLKMLGPSGTLDAGNGG
jgi:hypothetical protein